MNFNFLHNNKFSTYIVNSGEEMSCTVWAKKTAHARLGEAFAHTYVTCSYTLSGSRFLWFPKFF